MGAGGAFCPGGRAAAAGDPQDLPLLGPADAEEIKAEKTKL